MSLKRSCSYKCLTEKLLEVQLVDAFVHQPLTVLIKCALAQQVRGLLQQLARAFAP